MRTTRGQSCEKYFIMKLHVAIFLLAHYLLYWINHSFYTNSPANTSLNCPWINGIWCLKRPFFSSPCVVTSTIRRALVITSKCCNTLQLRCYWLRTSQQKKVSLEKWYKLNHEPVSLMLGGHYPILSTYTFLWRGLPHVHRLADNRWIKLNSDTFEIARVTPDTYSSPKTENLSRGVLFLHIHVSTYRTQATYLATTWNVRLK